MIDLKPSNQWLDLTVVSMEFLGEELTTDILEDQPSTLRQESSNWDNYAAQTTAPNPTYPSANITSHTPLNTSAEATYSATGVYNPTYGYETSDTGTIEGQMQNMRISGAALPVANNSYTSNPIPTSGPPQQTLKSDSRKYQRGN